LREIYAKLAAHEALKPDEQAYLDELNEADKADPFVSVIGSVNTAFDTLELGGMTPAETRAAILEVLEIQQRIYHLRKGD